jgi:hypothetical protein
MEEHADAQAATPAATTARTETLSVPFPPSSPLPLRSPIPPGFPPDSLLPPGSLLQGSRLAWLTLWSIAFGMSECAVVVYLRRLCYPGQPDDGPLFPLRVVDPLVLRTEWLREAATLIMLLAVACVAERRPLRRFAVFAFCFGIWDLAYYAVLAFLIGWPSSMMEWDVLFLIPAPWSSPVLAPVLVSLGLVGGAIALLARVDGHGPGPLRVRDWAGLIGCAGIILWSFLWNAGPVNRQEPPGAFPWLLFLLGWGGGLAWFLWRCRAAGAEGKTAGL